MIGLVVPSTSLAPVGADPVDPSVVVTPTSGLVDGQVAHVAGWGFPAEAGVAVDLCGPVELDGGRQCRRLNNTDADSGGSVEVDVWLRAIISQRSVPGPPPASPRVPVDCREALCVVVVSYWDSLTLETLGTLAHVPVVFEADGPLLPAPDVSVDPDRGIVDGQAVRVTFTNFDPTGYFGDVRLCRVGSDACDLQAGVPVVIDPFGSATVKLVLHASFSSHDGQLVDCRTPPGCEVEVQHWDRNLSYSALVRFGPPPRPPFVPPPSDPGQPSTSLPPSTTLPTATALPTATTLPTVTTLPASTSTSTPSTSATDPRLPAAPASPPRAQPATAMAAAPTYTG
ncbi:MAG: neocarzinostatin apoprotein domain-containing protein [Acidimicrobiales bacterium]